MITKLTHIIKGWYYRFRGLNLDLMLERIEKCKECSEILYLTKNETVCGECWCPLKSKCSVKEESCPQGKW